MAERSESGIEHSPFHLTELSSYELVQTFNDWVEKMNGLRRGGRAEEVIDMAKRIGNIRAVMSRRSDIIEERGKYRLKNTN